MFPWLFLSCVVFLCTFCNHAWSIHSLLAPPIPLGLWSPIGMSVMWGYYFIGGWLGLGTERDNPSSVVHTVKVTQAWERKERRESACREQQLCSIQCERQGYANKTTRRRETSLNGEETSVRQLWMLGVYGGWVSLMTMGTAVLNYPWALLAVT